MSEKHWMNQLFNSLHHWRKYSTTFGKVFKYLPETLYNKKRILNFVWLYFEQLSFASFFLSYSMNTTAWIILYSNNIAQHFNITQNWNVSIEKKTNSHLNFKCFSNKPTDHHGSHRANTQETETNNSWMTEVPIDTHE